MKAPRGFDLTGRVALVTGSSRGIGRAIAVALGQAGARVAVHCAGGVEQAEEVLAELGGPGRDAGCVVQADLAEDDAPRRVLDAANESLGSVDILVLNASVQFKRDAFGIDRDAFDRQVKVNLRSILEMIQLAAPAMRDRRWGRILTIGSVQQYQPRSVYSIYGALKAATEHLARNYARELGPYGVTVNNLAPGVIETDRNADALRDPELRQFFTDAIAARRFGTPDDCAAAALLLCSDAGGYITGVDLPVDGGLRIR